MARNAGLRFSSAEPVERVNPTHTDPISDFPVRHAPTQVFDMPYHFMSWNHGQLGRSGAALDLIQLCVAYSTGGHTQQHFPWLRFGVR